MTMSCILDWFGAGGLGVWLSVVCIGGAKAKKDCTKGRFCGERFTSLAFLLRSFLPFSFFLLENNELISCFLYFIAKKKKGRCMFNMFSMFTETIAMYCRYRS